MLVVVQNVFKVLIVQRTVRVLIEGAKIHVQEFVHSMLNVQLSGTFQYVVALKVQLAMHFHCALHLKVCINCLISFSINYYTRLMNHLL